jgi:hypothetical protein
VEATRESAIIPVDALGLVGMALATVLAAGYACATGVVAGTLVAGGTLVLDGVPVG